MLEREKSTDVVVDFFIHEWGSIQTIRDWIEMSEETEGCNVLNVDHHFGINFKLLMKPKTEALSNERERTTRRLLPRQEKEEMKKS